jgi:hypothetical protein
MRWNRWASVMMVGPLAGTLVGCGEDHIGSSALKTSGMYADFKASANRSATKVDAQLRAENKDGDIVILEAGDALLAGIDDETPRTLKADSNKEHYLQTFDDVTEAGTLVTIDFERRDAGDKDAPDSHVRLPEPFEMSLDVSGKVERDEDVVLTWEPNGVGESMFWWVSGDCVWSKEGETPDDGKYTLKAGDNIEVLDTRKDETCTVTVRLERHVHGTIDSAFRDGRFLGIQTRSKTFTSVPVPEEPEDQGTGGSGTTETGGSGGSPQNGGATNEAGAPSAGTAGSPSATGGTGTGGAIEEEAGAAGTATAGSGTGGSTQPAAGSAGTGQANAGSAGTSQATAGSAGASGQGGAGGQG